MLKKEHKEFFKTLGNEQRIEIVLALLEGSKNVTELTKVLKAEQSAISHNLKRLLECSFIQVEPNGKERVYSVNKETIAPLFDLIERHAKEYCKFQCCK